MLGKQTDEVRKWTGPLVTIECQNPATLEKLGEVPSLSAAEVAERLGVATKTVANHQSAIKQKLGVETGRGLVRHAMSLGLDPAG